MFFSKVWHKAKLIKTNTLCCPSKLCGTSLFLQYEGRGALARCSDLRKCQWGVRRHILVSGSVTQVFHNSLHKVASRGVPTKVSCPYLGRAYRNTHKHAHTQDNRVQGEEGIKAKGGGRGRALQTTCRQILLSNDKHSFKLTATQWTQIQKLRQLNEQILPPL